MTTQPQPPTHITLSRSDLAALLAHHADVLAAQLRADPARDGWIAAERLSEHGHALTAEEKTPAVAELLDSVLTFPLEQPPADRVALRARIAEALYGHSHPGWARCYADLDRDEHDTYLGRADAVLSVLPPTAGQAAGLPAGFRTAVVIAVKCAVCEYQFDEDQSYTVHFDTLAEAHQVLRDHGWTVLADGRAVCDSDGPDHDEWRGTSEANARAESDREHHQAEINAAINYALNEMP
ncbi:hypothetical protein PV396_24595 [Streptomyces sp. ME02-8801-2C]|uniref:hypothetical protein n=1 Tax=Streptomyces sp. ME02-8801-2C TaxID=3028680 RepID=UPI0029A28D03|nr:hypothetical protein [Streptomyces sp. ME02-8801-2C]MDX3455082.1 hypothetical protein [Streptomyces sp. ME02-8801-2C]